MSLGRVYQSLGRWAEAERIARDVLSRRRKANQVDSPDRADDLTAVGRALIKQAR
jgi:hypothetical protein